MTHGRVRTGGFLRGIRHALRGFGLLAAPGVRRFVVGPLVVNIGVFAYGLSSVGVLLNHAIERYLAGWPEWLQWLIWIVFAVLAVVVVFLTFSLVANFIASPFNGLLAEAVERHLRPQSGAADYSWQRLLAEAIRSVRAELHKLAYIALRALPLVVLSVVPGINALAPFLWLVFGAWMLGMEYLDCPLGNHGRLFPAVIDAMREDRAMALGFGGCMTLLTLIPVLNFLAMPIGVAGATSLYCEHLAAPDAG